MCSPRNLDILTSSRDPACCRLSRMTTLAWLLLFGEETDLRNSLSSGTLFASTERVTMDSSEEKEEEGKLPAVGVVGVEAADPAVLESLLQWARYLASLVVLESMLLLIYPEYYSTLQGDRSVCFLGDVDIKT